ncbi:glycosyltransferase 87 family protein [Actinophytocola sp.]|uniref:glycosyltransferase 87 family protein n=1 Tax=Actinophytocola sp. TaxID=1872138 RepID=UPI002ED01B45
MRKIGLVVLNAAVLAWFVVPERLRIDLDVYRLGADVWLSGGDLYGLLPPTIIGKHLPFTYPPISAVLFTPFTFPPHPVAGVLLTVLSVAALALVLVVVTRSLDLKPALVAVLLPAALLLDPVRVTLYFGQINLLLMALVVLDCLLPRTRWPRGVLVGLAAAIKLTPAAFVLFFLLRGDRRAAVTAMVSFVGVSAIGFLLNPSGSVKYWTSTVFNPNRIGKVADEANQSINGVLTRLGIERGWPWLLLVVAVIAAGAVAVKLAPHPVEALGLNALVVLLVSPVSWSHHWVWCVPILLAVWRIQPLVAAAGAVAFYLSPHWWWDSDDGLTVLTLTVGNVYVWCAVFVFWSAHRQFRRTRVDVHHRAVA